MNNKKFLRTGTILGIEWKIDGILTSIDALPTGDKSSLLQWRLEPGGSVVLELQIK